MRRRTLLLTGLAFGFSQTVIGQNRPSPKLPKVGMLWHAGNAEEEGSYFDSLMQGFADLGYVDRRTILLEHVYADEKYERFPAMAQELLNRNVDVIMASILPAARAAQQLTTTVPIVFVIVSDPVGSGLVKSLARPEGNLTGMSNVTEELTAKRVQIFKEAVPTMRRMGLLYYPEVQRGPRTVEEYREAASALDMELVVLEVRTPFEIEAAVAGARAMSLDGVAAAPELDDLQCTPPDRRAGTRTSSAHNRCERGHRTRRRLIAYGPNHADIFRRSTTVVHKILEGERPNEIPVQQPVKFLLRVNLRTAKAIGVEISPTLLARADEVIE